MDKLYVDFDNTIANSIKSIVTLYNKDFHYYPDFNYIDWIEIKTWGFKECKCAGTEYLNTYFNQSRFFDRLDFMDNAKEILNILKDEYEVNVISIGSKPNLILKEKWLKQFMPYAKFIGINGEEYSDKSCIDMSDGILIDDSEKNLYLSNAPVSICFGDIYEWNEKWEGIRCFNWVDVRNIVGKRGKNYG